MSACPQVSGYLASVAQLRTTLDHLPTYAIDTMARRRECELHEAGECDCVRHTAMVLELQARLNGARS